MSLYIRLLHLLPAVVFVLFFRPIIPATGGSVKLLESWCFWSFFPHVIDKLLVRILPEILHNLFILNSLVSLHLVQEDAVHAHVPDSPLAVPVPTCRMGHHAGS